ncbi:NAD(P)-binding Rossmann-fold containing protein [Glarea lozoyensis ATCC 20868]|uniref:NAD(P)-binding Rossmann-fold containing protein n=1 Tax=Glarea lozoyensis (strain ATCC 20868 / MF5171) TaxID=1116229 RepID=S3CYW7_GLAL2|nr:NAD(P)-binding Rossmann-fold containing protein [Glarea lozoyensis ATCC 20868]EPE31472.1 NAD(P)-binding Rossmann-fold containing protein [Glarea lozoyensis ATCC 20868]
MTTSTASGSRLAGKVAIVTGGGSGFGEAISKRFSDEGCKVIVADMNPEGGGRVSQHNKDNMHFVQMNVAKSNDWESCLKQCIGKWGRVDVVVNNAGTSYPNKPTAEVTEDDFDKVFAVNVKSVYHCSAIVIPTLIKQGNGGSIINIASIGATRPRPGLVWYNSSKAAVTNATKGLAAEYGNKNIRVNSICPLLSATGLFETFVGVPPTEENFKKFLFNVPLGRLTDPLDIANYSLFLASEEAKFITGTCLEIDGGRGI